eukprot:5295645-Heterocapsa_arctica.AAC.1
MSMGRGTTATCRRSSSSSSSRRSAGVSLWLGRDLAHDDGASPNEETPRRLPRHALVDAGR